MADYPIAALYRGDSLGSLQYITCATWGAPSFFTGEAGVTYYFQLGNNSYMTGVGGSLALNIVIVPAPPNDDFAEALTVTGLPYSDTQDMQGATVEAGEPTPGYAWSTPSRSIWYRYTPDEDISLIPQGSYSWYYGALTVYTGDALTNLTEIDCATPYTSLAVVQAQKGVTYYFQLTNIYPGDSGSVQFNLNETPPPVASFYWTSGDVSKYDTVTFYDNSYDPIYIGFSDYWWDFGDGATAIGYSASHQYAADGDYTAWHKVKMWDGRTAETTQVVSVRTHDVAINKFTVPQSASAGQTRPIVVGVRNNIYTEDLQVELYKSSINGYVLVGTLRQQVPVRSGGRTTDFTFSYTFTKDDAKLGKVTFRAIATLQGARDALPADNEAVALPTKVLGK